MGDGCSIQLAAYKSIFDDPRLLAVVISYVVAFFILPLLGIWLARMGRRWFLAGDGEPRCGACGYSVRELTSLNCPECGGDLRGVGIVRIDPAGLPWTLVAWTALIGVLGLLSLGVMFALMMVFPASYPAPFNQMEWAPTSVVVAYVVAWGLGVVVIIRFRQRAVVGPLQVAPAGASQATPASLPVVGAGDGAAVSRVLTIMFIDMQGYTARAGDSSRQDLVALIRQVRELVRPVVQARGGRIVKTMGDGFLVTFESPTDAVLAGCEIQRAAFMPDTAGVKGMSLRIGVTTGEVAIEEDDVYGDPVNMAARIQQLANPGDVLFSEGTWHAMTRNEIEHEDAGEFELKGMAKPTRLFRARVRSS